MTGIEEIVGYAGHNRTRVSSKRKISNFLLRQLQKKNEIKIKLVRLIFITLSLFLISEKND